MEFSSATVNGNVFAFGGYQFVPVYPFKNVFRFNTNGEWSVLDYEIQSWRFSFRAVSQGTNRCFAVTNYVVVIQCFSRNLIEPRRKDEL